MIEFPVPQDRAFSSQNHSILGQSLVLSLNYNSTDKAWRLSLRGANNTPIILGRRLVPLTSPTRPYALDTLRGGNFWVFAKTLTDQPLAYDNFGIGKAYGLFFLTTDEEEALEL